VRPALCFDTGQISTRRLRKVSPADQQEEEYETVSSNPLGKERVPLSSRSERRVP